MNIVTKPWTVGNPPPCAENWTEPEREKCVAAGNSVLAEGGSEQDAIFACIAAAGKSEQKDEPKVGNIEDLVSTWNEWAGSYDQCVETLSGKEGISDPESLCAWMHHEAEGKWPGEKPEKKSSKARGRKPTDEEISRIVEIIEQKNEETDVDENTVTKQTAKVLPFSIINDQVVFGEPVEGAMKFVPRDAEEDAVGEKTSAPSWKCGAARDLPVNEEKSWDGAAAKGRIFSWAGWDDNPKPAQARRCFLAYDSANPELRGSYKLPFADIVDGNPVAIRAGLGNANSRLRQTKGIPESVLDSGQAVIEGYKGKYEKELVEGSEKGYAGADTKFKIFERDGQTMWIAVTSTAFKDREKEIVSRNALDYSIWFSDITGYRGYLNLYHMPNVKLAQCDFQMRIDEVLLEGGKWFDNEYANAVRDWVDNRAGQGGADEAGCSIEFVYNPEDRVKGIYDRIIIFNRAVLKRKHAANPYTWMESPEQIRRKNMSTVDDIKEILGDELAEEAISGAKEHSKEVRETGAEFKGETVEPEAVVGDEPAEKPKEEVASEESAAPVEQPAAKEAKETVVEFSEEGIKVLSEAIAKNLGIAEMRAGLEALAASVKALVASDEAIKAKVKLVPNAVLRDSKMAAEDPLPDDQIVGAEEKKSPEDEVAEARKKAYDGFVK